MGFWSRLLGRGDDDDLPPISAVVSTEPVRAAVEALADAVEALAEGMDSDLSPSQNPGWMGRLRDLRTAHRDLRLLCSRPEFTKDDLYDVLTCVTPLYRGTPPEHFAHLDELNTGVVIALERVHATV